MKYIAEEIKNMDGVTKNIIVSTKDAPIKMVDLAIGLTGVALGIGYLMWTAFKNGADAHSAGELKTMINLGIIHDD